MTEPPRHRLLMGVCGSIAAYKGADLCSKLVQAGHDVTVVMTQAATRLVGPLTFAALSGRPVAQDPFRTAEGLHAEHVDLADHADLALVAPATANFLAKAACGIADDLLTSTLLAVRCPVLVVPAMNVHMWRHPTVTRNVATLRDLGYHVMEPDEGHLACGHVGAGRLPEPEVILQRVADLLPTG